MPSSYPQSTAPGQRFAAVTKSDSIDLPEPCRALYIGVTGDVSVLGVNASAPVVFKAVPAGAILPVNAIRVYNTATTATDIVAIS